MKTLWKLATYVAVVLLSLNVCSCGDDDEEAKGSVNELIGIWEGVSGDEWIIENGKRTEENGKDISDERYEFKSDMTFNLLWKENNTWKVSEYGKWEFDKNTIKLIYYYPNDGGYDEEDPDILKILELSESTLVWEYYSKGPDLELYMKESYRKVN